MRPSRSRSTPPRPEELQFPTFGLRLPAVILNFVRENTPESCTRLCALLCCLTGCAVALATVRFAFINPERATTITALVGTTSALIAAGCVALLTRSRKTEDRRLKTEAGNGWPEAGGRRLAPDSQRPEDGSRSVRETKSRGGDS